MTDVFLVRHDIEPGKTARAKALFEEIRAIGEEDGVTNVLQKEGVYTESAFFQESTDGDGHGDSILYYIEAEDAERVYDVFKQLEADPDGEAEELAGFLHELTDVMDGDPYVAEEFDLLYHLVTPERP